MKPRAYYNEYEPSAAAWLRNLIAHGLIAPGDVDTRSIEDVRPDDLRGYTQCHFFAGIGVWSYALRRAGWPDDRPIWTGSCPCQPFSTAGKGLAFADERHLWPAFYHLISECRPPIVTGEQVASSPVDDWVDLVHADMEALGYPFGSIPFPAAGVGAPHIRDRNYWLAHASSQGLSKRKRNGRIQREALGALAGQAADGGGIAGRLANSNVAGAKRFGEHGRQGQASAGIWSGLANSRQLGGVAAPKGGRLGQGTKNAGGVCERDGEAGLQGQGFTDHSATDGAGPTNGFWRDADWLGCTDGKFRPVEPGTFPLADGASARVGRLRGYGNAINAEAAIAWVEAMMSSLGIEAVSHVQNGSISQTIIEKATA